MKKILILANNDIGLYRFRKELIEELLKRYIVIISLPNGEMVQPLIEMGCKFIDTPIDRRGMNPLKDLKLYFYYKKIIKEKRPDLIITYTIKPGIYGGYACRRLKIPYLENITGLGSAFQNEGILKKLIINMYKIGLKKAKVVFFENRENRLIFTQKHIIPEEITYVLNGAGVNLQHYQVTEYPLDKEVIRFLFIGRIMKEKGIEELFSVMQQLNKNVICCTLDVLGEYEEDYREQMEKFETEGWLHYYGYQQDVRPYIYNCHCLVLPSWHEGMANTILESAASGRPVIASNIHGCLEAVQDGVSGYLCEKKNAKDLYRVMEKFIRLPNYERKAMGLAGRKLMEDKFDKKQIIKETIQFIQL